MTDLNERIAKLSSEKRALLERELMKQDATGVKDVGIPRRTESGPCRLSFAQERMRLLNQMVPDSPVYNIPETFRIKGILNVEALEKALCGIVTRHEVLRSTVALIRGTPMQMVVDSWSVPLPVIDLSVWTETVRTEASNESI